MKKLTKIISPSYVKGFECIAGDCEDSCCIGWNIDIDKITYRRYFRTKDMLMKKEFVKHIHRNEDSHCDEVDYGRARMQESKYCPFLNEDKLCRIYINLGEDYLSNVCSSFPRVYNILDGSYELSLYMSCPEAVRKLLESREPIKFIEEDISLNKHIINSAVDTKDKRWKGSPIRRLKELRSMSIAAIQNRELSITDRLLKLGYELQKISRSEQSDKNSSHDPLKVPDNHIFQLGFFRNAIESLQVFSEIDSSQFIDLTKKVLAGFSLMEDRPLKEKSQLYEEALITVLDPYMRENSYLFEHYLVNSMFQGNFPFTVNDNIFDGYLMMTVRYAFIRFYLAGIAAVDGEISKDDLVLMIQVHTKTIDHHDSFILNQLEELREKQFDNMEFVSSLLG